MLRLCQSIRPPSLCDRENQVDLCYAVTDRDQRHPAVSTATQANTCDLAKWHIDHAAHSQPVFVRLAFLTIGEGLCGHQGDSTTTAS
jgi:hypothetical protein